MDLYNLKITPCNCFPNCLSQTITVDANINDLIVGNIYSFSSTTDCNQNNLLNAERGFNKCFPFGCYSIDGIELIMAIQKKYEVRIGDQNLARSVLESVNSIAEFVAKERKG